MESISLAAFFHQRIQETIDHIQYVAKVEISYDDKETFGNKYISVMYEVTTGPEFDLLDNNKQKELFQGAGNYTFTLSTNQERVNKSKHLILQILEFKNVYASLSAYAAMQLEKYRSQRFTFGIKSITLWPVANHIEEFLIETLDKTVDRWAISVYDIEERALQWTGLHQLARDTRGKSKEQFCITDIEINRLTQWELREIRDIILRAKVPIKITGFKIIESISIHVGKFIAALKKEVNNASYPPRIDFYKSLINYLYDKYQPSEKEDVMQQQQMEFLAHFSIQTDDVIQLKNKQMVMVDAVIIEADNAVKIRYAVIKTNLEKSERTKVIEIREVMRVLKRDNYAKYLEHVSVKHTSLLKNWMAKEGVEMVAEEFVPDLTK